MHYHEHDVRDVNVTAEILGIHVLPSCTLSESPQPTCRRWEAEVVAL